MPRIYYTCDRFQNKENFNDDISRWDVSAVSDMELMYARTRECAKTHITFCLRGEIVDWMDIALLFLRTAWARKGQVVGCTRRAAGA